LAAAAEASLAAELSSGRLTSLGGKSEATGLADHSVDVIIAAQVRAVRRFHCRLATP
jgi:hypothetical protein